MPMFPKIDIAFNAKLPLRAYVGNKGQLLFTEHQAFVFLYGCNYSSRDKEKAEVLAKKYNRHMPIWATRSSTIQGFLEGKIICSYPAFSQKNHPMYEYMTLCSALKYIAEQGKLSEHQELLLHFLLKQAEPHIKM